MQPVSSNEIKKVKSLSQKKFRDSTGLFVVEGEKMVAEALGSGFEIVRTYRISETGESAMARMTSLSTPSPVLAVVRKPQEKTADEIPASGLCLGLDSLRDPGNLGTVMRIADWFGIKNVYATHDTVDLYNPKVVQATMGAIFRVGFHYCDLKETAKRFLDAGGKVYGTFLDGRDIYSSELSTGDDSPVMLVIGNESNGISDGVASVVSERLFIPPWPAGNSGPESLNAAVAAAIASAEFRRRTKR